VKDILYTDFDVFVYARRDDSYGARVVLNDGSEATTTFQPPCTPGEIEALHAELLAPRGVKLSPADGDAPPEPPALNKVIALGDRLFEALFSGAVRDHYKALYFDAVRGQNAGVRIRLNLREAPDLLVLPWEYLFDREAWQFLALSEKTPVVRHLGIGSPVRAVDVTAPIRVLALAPQPRGTETLAVGKELRNLEAALAQLREDGKVVLELVEPPTCRALRERLDSSTSYHVLHFLGHGSFNDADQEGTLWFEGPGGEKDEVSGELLAELLHDHDSLRLVLLNSCEGAETSATHPFAGLAQALVRKAIPAIIAMQSTISDVAAVEFSESLYRSLGLGRPLEAAVASGRMAVRSHVSVTEWATPVFYTRLPNGRLFEISEVSPENRQLLRDKSTLGKLWTAGSRSSIALVFGMWAEGLSELGEREPVVALPYALMIGELRQFLQPHYDEVSLAAGAPPGHDGTVVYLGGPVTIPAVGDVIDRAAPPFWFRGLPYEGESPRSIGQPGIAYTPELDAERHLVSDVGVAVRVIDGGRLTFVIAGCYGSGTLGAARLLMDADRVRQLGDLEGVDRLQLVVGVTTDGWQVADVQTLQVVKGW
jgi:hypothetical protein